MAVSREAANLQARQATALNSIIIIIIIILKPLKRQPTSFFHCQPNEYSYLCGEEKNAFPFYQPRKCANEIPPRSYLAKANLRQTSTTGCLQVEELSLSLSRSSPQVVQLELIRAKRQTDREIHISLALSREEKNFKAQKYQCLLVLTELLR